MPGKAITSAFGVTGVKEETRRMVVKLGHAPFTTDKTREENMSRDIDRIVDVLEGFAWPTGVEAVFYEDESAVTNKDNAMWWTTEMSFKVLFLSAIETS